MNNIMTNFRGGNGSLYLAFLYDTLLKNNIDFDLLLHTSFYALCNSQETLIVLEIFMTI